ncbi:Uncharacterized protein HSRCO_2253 [Halanaeroarchaeum sp. HSR-CO]|uniref:DUF447 domain-containing protein n=1 Tax=Halanaeroarchaeum sp. HSR-CO TaxID=2866382 RepID=UPI00217D1329|nr:DUF447 domain-containing protein [Halanaeroarchaeum sp. HSR-CO]UWG48522.1 Uncharacterized protein HSRCO_2253 [Halanaeroarchaeum sp. HSR-CO]
MTDWPVDFDGIAETVTLTPDPDDRWNVAALGVRAGDPATARTWGETITRQNFERTGTGVVTFVEDPVLFVEAALTERKAEGRDIDGVAAWVEVSVDERERGTSGGTTWVDWALAPIDGEVVRRSVPVTNRGFNAVVEMTVAASRLGVPVYDAETLRTRLAYFEEVVATCGGEREEQALEKLRDVADW